MPVGPLSSPSPEPAAPHVPSSSPSVLKIETRFRYSSLTYSRSSLSNATATGSVNCPSSLPYPLPNSSI